MKKLKALLQKVFMFGKILSLVFDSRWDTLINSVPAMKQACDQFKDMVAAINAKIGRYHSITRGIADQKRVVRAALNEISFSIMSSCRSWAIQNSNLELAAKLEITFSEIRKMAYKNYMPLIENSITEVEPHVSQLAPFNVSPETFALWKQKFQAMQNILTGPESAVKARKTLGTTIMNDVKSAMDFLDNQLTPLVANFQSTPEFFIGFYNNKRIGQPNTHHTRLIAHVVNEVGTPYYALTVTVDQYTDPKTGKTYAADSAITDPDGNCEVSGFFPGFRTITISGANIQTTSFPAIEFLSGKAENREFIVAPSFNNIPAPAESKKQKANP